MSSPPSLTKNGGAVRGEEAAWSITRVVGIVLYPEAPNYTGMTGLEARDTYGVHDDPTLRAEMKGANRRSIEEEVVRLSHKGRTPKEVNDLGERVD